MTLLLLYGVNLLVLAINFANRDTLIDGPVPRFNEPERVAGALPPSVTVQLPMYNERFVADRLIDACAKLDYPADRLDIQILDDSTDDTAAIAEERTNYWKQRGVRILHLRRSDRTGYKAGALQAGLKLSRAEFVAVFDADFVPDSGFLREVIGAFDSPKIGMVQARWSHLNEADSLLTRIQAFGLDTHFAIEQRVRNLTGCFINFNGTAGVWRRTCIDESGGWSADTLAEDLDLSYRAQLRGWRFKYLPRATAPAELPADMNAFRAQQFRWTKGTTQTAMKMLGPLWASEFPLSVKLEGTVHLTAHLAFPLVLILGLLNVPLLWMRSRTGMPGDVYFSMLSLGVLGFVGFFLAQLFAQRELYPDWKRRMLLFPAFMAGSMGLAVNNTRAVLEAVLRKRSTFVRTPKLRAVTAGDGAEVDVAGTFMRGGSRNSRQSNEEDYIASRLPAEFWVEIGMLAYLTVGLAWLIAHGAWLAIPFQLLLVAGFSLVVVYTAVGMRRAPTDEEVLSR
ncbi:MAG: glycosyltransferase family 2 protein [Bacteroidetes bacterium]|nr:glycosyltransferase family 2 protein [Bacteroidota bacterium]